MFYIKVWNICDWQQGPGTLRVSESRIMDTTDWSKLRVEQCNVDLSQNVCWMSNQEGSVERESREVRVTFSADVLEAIYMLEDLGLSRRSVLKCC